MPRVSALNGRPTRPVEARRKMRATRERAREPPTRSRSTFAFDDEETPRIRQLGGGQAPRPTPLYEERESG